MGFSVEELSTKLSTTEGKILAVIKSLIEMRIISLPSNFPKNVKHFTAVGITKISQHSDRVNSLKCINKINFDQFN
jgi:hypothetical protein